jgi:hypothetical protein
MTSRLLALAALAVAGCGGTAYVPVSGRVNLDGAPLAGAVVLFQPDGTGSHAGPGSSGVTAADGSFTLGVIGLDRPGAVPGRHRVVISAVQAQAGGGEKGGPVPDRVPARYGYGGDLTFEVPAAGTSAAIFELTSR